MMGKVTCKFGLFLIAFGMSLVLTKAFHLPFGELPPRLENEASRRQDDGEGQDYDDMDPKASENQYNNQADNHGDGYGENEPDSDAPYDESPKDQEGQADLERFFDDHLGASDKEGMDRENLPTNLIPTVTEMFPKENSQDKSSQSTTINQTENSIDSILNDQARRQSEMLLYLKQRRSLLGAEKGDIQEPYAKQLFDDLKPNGTIYSRFQEPWSSPVNPMPSIDDPVAKGTNNMRVVAGEDEEMDKVYETHKTNEPFKIDALGGFDPEEDFKNASNDLNESSKRGSRSAQDSSSPEATIEPQKDIVFNDSDADALFNDASETDEVAFATDEPDWNDAVATQPVQTIDVDDDADADADPDGDSGDELSIAQSRVRPRNRDDDIDDGAWVNDGVDDMEIPSNSEQERVIRKTARQEALARRMAKQQPQQDDQDPSDQRMPNADYLKEDLKDLDDETNRR